MRADIVLLKRALGGVTKAYRVLLAPEELAENAAAIGPEHERHAHQRTSGHHARRHRQGEFFGEIRFASLEQKRNEGAQKKQKPNEGLTPLAGGGPARDQRGGGCAAQAVRAGMNFDGTAGALAATASTVLSFTIISAPCHGTAPSIMFTGNSARSGELTVSTKSPVVL